MDDTKRSYIAFLETLVGTPDCYKFYTSQGWSSGTITEVGSDFVRIEDSDTFAIILFSSLAKVHLVRSTEM